MAQAVFCIARREEQAQRIVIEEFGGFAAQDALSQVFEAPPRINELAA